jgi:hypothetical protein
MYLKLSNRRIVLGCFLFTLLCTHVPLQLFAQSTVETWDFSFTVGSRCLMTNLLFGAYQGNLKVQLTTQSVSRATINLKKQRTEIDTLESGILIIPEGSVTFVNSNNTWKIENLATYTYLQSKGLAFMTGLMLSVATIDKQQIHHANDGTWWWGDAPFQKRNALVVERIMWKPSEKNESIFIAENNRDIFYANINENVCVIRVAIVEGLSNPEQRASAYNIVTNEMLTGSQVLNHPSIFKTQAFGFAEAKLTKKTQ